MIDIWEMESGLSEVDAKAEASRCLSCKNPQCEVGCPASLRIRDFIKEIKNDNLVAASAIINSCSSLPNICSIVCPHEKQCIGHCILNAKGKPINCGGLERYVVSKASTKYEKNLNSSLKVAIIGSGPAGIACAKELAKNGASVTIYEKTSYFGGLLTTGIPSYRLDYCEVEKLLSELNDLGVKIIYNANIKESDILNLKTDYDAIFIGTGLTKVKKLGIPNENIAGVYNALDFLKDVNINIKLGIGKLPKLNGKTIVIGAGNVAMDAARCAKRLGSDVTICYRRSRLEAPATKHEIALAEAEGVELRFLNNPVEILGKDKVEGIKVEIMKLGEPDESGRRKPVGTNQFEIIKCDNVISAIGQNPDSNIYDKNELKTDYGYLVCDENYRTNISGIYAGGDIVLGAKTVVEAMVCGRKVAKLILNQ